MHTLFSGRRSGQQRAQAMPVVCAWCRSRERIGGHWGPLRSDPNTDHVSHGICPACLAREQAKLDAAS